jgi:methylase of polypeptide subunit release factors
MKAIGRWLAVAALGLAAVGVALSQEGRGDVVYVPTPQIVVEEMFAMAKLGPNDFLIDLGSGDGRMVITAAKKFGARGFGVDLDTYLLKVASQNAQKEGVADRVQFFEQNLFETDLKQATVISSYLLPEMNLKLRPKIMQLKPGTRVVAHDYHMGDWYPDDQKTIPVPEKQVGNPGVSYIYLWYVPAVVAGQWQSSVNIGGRDLVYEFSFEQLFQVIDGTLRAGGHSARFTSRVQGDQIAFVVPKAGEGGQRHEFRGQIRDGVIEGTLRIGDGAAQRQVPWVAKQVAKAAPRRPADERR